MSFNIIVQYNAIRYSIMLNDMSMQVHYTTELELRYHSLLLAQHCVARLVILCALS